MYDAVICEPVRTPVGGFGGVFKDVPVTTLAATVMRGLIDRTGLQSCDIDDVVFGQGYANGEAAAIGRIAALDAGLDISVPGIQLDRRCGSGLQAIIYAAMQVQTGMSDLVIAGGAESMSGVEFYSNDIRWGTKKPSVEFHDRLAKPRTNSGGVNFPVDGGMIETAENLRREYAISRDEQDRYALRSHERAVNAQDKGYFDEEIIPVTVPSAAATRKLLPRTSIHVVTCNCPTSLHFAHYVVASTPTRPSPPAMPADRTTAAQRPSSPRPPMPNDSGCAPSRNWSAGVSPVSSRTAWASDLSLLSRKHCRESICNSPIST